ncbi:MAG: hypothetical protein OHK0039_25230 [Bacteroidia bacterium]
MKRIVLTLFMGISLLAAQAQLKPAQGDISFGFRFSGLSNLSIDAWSAGAFDTPELLGRYYISDQLALRARIGINVGSQTSDYTDTYIDSVRFPQARKIDTSVVERVSTAAFSFTPGIEYHFTTEAARVDPYVGGEIVFGVLGTTTTETDRNYIISVAADGVPLYNEDLNIKTRADGGLVVGLNVLGGFNYFFSDKIAVGAEYALGFSYLTQGGNIQTATTGTILLSNQTDVIPVNVTEVFEVSSNSFNLSTAASGGIHLSVFF